MPSSPADSGETGTEGGGTSKPEEKKIIKVTSKTTQEPAIIFFPDTEINKVEVTSATPIDGVPNMFSGNHFNYNKNDGKLELSTSGLSTFDQPAFIKGEYKYELKFKFNDDWELAKQKSVEITIIKDY